MSVNALSLTARGEFPAICSGVSGDTCRTFSLSERARISWPATFDPWAAMHCTQLTVTVGELSLKRETCVPGVYSQTSSMTSHSTRSPTISRSKFFRCPLCLAFVWRTACFMLWPLHAKDRWFAFSAVADNDAPDAMQGCNLDSHKVWFPHHQFPARSGVLCQLLYQCPTVLHHFP